LPVSPGAGWSVTEAGEDEGSWNREATEDRVNLIALHSFAALLYITRILQNEMTGGERGEKRRGVEEQESRGEERGVERIAKEQSKGYKDRESMKDGKSWRKMAGRREGEGPCV